MLQVIRQFQSTFTSVPVPTYSVTATAGTGGTISPSGTNTVNPRNSCYIYTISPSTGFRINSVTVDGVSQGAVTTYAFPSNSTGSHTISVTFAQITFTIAASAGSNGAISPSGSVTVNSGASQVFTVTPAIRVSSCISDSQR
jgi:endoglucanase